MIKTRNIVIFLLLVIAQIFLNNFANLSQYLLLSVLPVLVLCLPVETRTLVALVVAFVTGLAVDFFSNGLLGLTVFALVPVAMCRYQIVRMVFGDDLLARGEDITVRRQGVPKMALATLMVNTVYFAFYIWADCAGTRSFWFCLLRLLLSVLLSTVVSVFIAAYITSED